MAFENIRNIRKNREFKINDKVMYRYDIRKDNYYHKFDKKIYTIVSTIDDYVRLNDGLITSNIQHVRENKNGFEPPFNEMLLGSNICFWCNYKLKKYNDYVFYCPKCLR